MAKSINRKFGQFAKYVESDGDVKFIAGGNILITNANGVVTIAYDGAPALPSGQSLLYNDSLPTDAITGSLSFSSALNSIHFKSDDSWFRLAIFGQDSIGNILAQLDSVVLVIPSQWAVFNNSLQAWKGDYELVAALEGNTNQGLGSNLVGYSRNIVSGTISTSLDSSRTSASSNMTISNIENASIAYEDASLQALIDGQLGTSPFNDNLVYTTSLNSNRGNLYGKRGLAVIPRSASKAVPEIAVYNGNSKIEIFQRNIGSSNWSLNRTKDEPGGYVEDNGFGSAIVHLYSGVCAVSAPKADNPATPGGGVIYTYNLAGTGTSFYQKLYPTNTSCYALASYPNWLAYSGTYGRATSNNWINFAGSKIGRHLAALDLNYRIYTWTQPNSAASQQLLNAWTYTGYYNSNTDGYNMNFRTVDVHGDTLVGAGFISVSPSQPNLKVFKWNESTNTFDYSQFLYYEDSYAGINGVASPSSLLVDSDEGTIFVGYGGATNSSGARSGAVLVYQRDSDNGLFEYKNSIRTDDPLSYSFGSSIMKPNSMQHAIIIGDPDYRLNSGKIYLYTSKSGVIQYGANVENDNQSTFEVDYQSNEEFVDGVLNNITYSTSYNLPGNPSFSTTFGTMEFNDSGTKLIFGNQGITMNVFSLSTAWDLSTLSYDSSYTVGSYDASDRSFTFGKNGYKMYVARAGAINEHDLTTAYDPRTISSTLNSITYPTDFETAPNGSINILSVQFSNDGYRIYLLDDYDNNSLAGQPGIWTGKLTTPWDLSTLDGSVTYGRDYFDWSEHGRGARNTADAGNVLNSLSIVKNQRGFGSAAFAAYARGLDSTADDGIIFGGQGNGNYFSTRAFIAPVTAGSARLVTWSNDNRKLYQSNGLVVWEFDVSI